MKLNKRPYLVIGTSAALFIAQALTPSATGFASSSSAGTSLGQVVFVGTTGLATQAGSAIDGSTDEIIPNFVGHQPKNPNLNHVAADGVPQVAGSAIVAGQLSDFGGFNAINHRDQRRAGTGPYTNTQFSLEPPDQGLCAGNGFVLEPVNDALRVFNTSGTPLAPTTALNQFFNQKPAFNRTTHVFGDFLSDPKCY